MANDIAQNEGGRTVKNRTIGILAHVDAGKTTLCEQMLYHTGAVRSLGRVDHGDTTLDIDPIERARGITVFSDQAIFYDDRGNCYTLIDTPGHVDFVAETERVLSALDAVILLVDSTDGIKPHTVMLERLARQWNVPTILFLNKCDLPTSDPAKAIRQAKERFQAYPISLPIEPEQVAELDERFLELYLNESYGDADTLEALKRVFYSGAAMPVLQGSAMTGEGVDALLATLGNLMQDVRGSAASALDAKVYKVRHDAKGGRVTFVRIEEGTIHPRDAFTFGERIEKVHEIRKYHGARYEIVEQAIPGDAVGLVGLTVPNCGDRIREKDGVRTCVERMRFESQPALAARVTSMDGWTDSALLEKFRILEDEETQLGVTYDASTKEILVHVMGPIQLEVLEQLMQTRYGAKVAFSPPKVLYKETIAAPTMGYGHYEPLRHYAEVNLRIEPMPRGKGISFASECHVDELSLNFQRLIETHVFERVHRGVLTGSKLTDVRVVLTDGRAHLKHTEGGDFREATYRAIRQGLMHAENRLLEPFYRFEIIVPSEYSGRVMADIQKMSGTFDSPQTLGEDVRISGRGPVATFADYGLTLRAATHGQGSAFLIMDGYDLCHNADEVIAGRGYDPNADLEQPASSVFCAHGAGFVVPWNEAENYMHCLKK